MRMKLFGSSLFRQAIKSAGVGAVLMLSVTASHAQSGPFAGFSGAWSRNGTVVLSDGTIELFVPAAGFAASLTLQTNGNRQTVEISSKGEIKGVNITMVKS